MPVFTAIAAGVASIATAIGFTAAAATVAGAVAAFAARTLLTIGITKLLVNRKGNKAAGTQDAGARIQLPPSTDNKLPVVYGSAFIGGAITDAKLTTDQKTMYYVVSLAEVTDTTAGSAYTYGNIYYDGKLVTFDGTDPAKVISLTTNTAGTPEVDTKIAGSLFIYLFTNGSSSGVNTGGQSAITILSDAGIPADIRWNSSLYTTGGQSPTMTNTAFAIVKVIYNQDSGTTNLGSLTVQLTNSLKQPGSVLKDYMLNTRYGCAIPLASIDTASLSALDAYSAQTIIYVPVGGGSATQARYEINGPLNTGIDCMTNLQNIVDSCDSWLQYSELNGQWKVVINRSYTDFTTLNALYSVDDDNLIGGIEVNPLDLNGTYNIMEVQYPNKYIKDQTDFQTVSLFTSYPSLLSPNEPVNKLIIQYPQVNNAVQAKYLGLRRLLQGREDLVINFATDYSGIQVEAGDVIKVTLSQYGWTDKLFRVSNVVEEKYPDGSLGARITAFEYNDTIYADNAIQDFIPAANTGLTDPNIIDKPDPPTFSLNVANTISQLTVDGVVPLKGQILYMDFNYGNTANALEHLYYATVSGNGEPLTANSNVDINMTDLPTGNYYWSITAKNNSVGVRSNASANFVVWPGPSVTQWDGNTGGITGNNIQANTITNNNLVDATIQGNKVASNTISSNNLTITGVVANTYVSVANLNVDAAGRIISVSLGSATALDIQYANGTQYGVANLKITGAASVTQTAAGNVTLDIDYQGNLVLDATSFGPEGTNTFANVTTYFGSTSINNQCLIPGTYQNDGTGNATTYTLTLPDDYFPAFYGTASTTDGFLANSSGVTTYYFPHETVWQIIGETIAGNTEIGLHGWFPVLQSTVPTGNAGDTGNLYRNSQIYNSGGALTVLADANVELWYAPFVNRLNGVGGNNDSQWIVYYPEMQVVDLVADRPFTISLPMSYFKGNTNIGQGEAHGIAGDGFNRLQRMGWAVRAPDAGNVYVIGGSQVIIYNGTLQSIL